MEYRQRKKVAAPNAAGSAHINVWTGSG